jgi:hypothetical protein
VKIFGVSGLYGIGLLVGAASFLLFSVPATATPMGHLDVANCAAGGVTVGPTTITWNPPQNGGGCIQTGDGTNIQYGAGSTLGSGVSGTILNLVAGVLPVNSFMTFMGAAGLHFDLTGVGPGSGNVSCGTLTVGNSCSAVAGSPFILTLVGINSTTVTLQAFGTVGDGFGPDSTWAGGFSQNISNMTPAAIQTAILGGGSVSSTYAGDFSLTIGAVGTPEPGTSSLFALGIGLVALSFVKFRRPSGKRE